MAAIRRRIPNLLIVGGDGRNSGKTAMICRILSELKDPSVVPVKINQTFHELGRGLIPLLEENGLKIFEETSLWSAKDTSRMLLAGASRVIYIQSADDRLAEAFALTEKLLPKGSPVLCESSMLIRYCDPGVYVFMKGSDKPSADNGEQEKYDHVSFTIQELDSTPALPFRFTGGEWKK